MKKFSLIIFIIISLFIYTKAQAADIFLVSDNLNPLVNQTFNISVYTNTKDVNINNIEAKISYSKDLVEVISVNNSPSIFSIWVEPPNFSNTTGLISFNGGLPTPGYKGNMGKIINISLKAKKTGIAEISFPSASIYANDGMGTNVITEKRGLSLKINQATAPEVIKDIVVDNLPPMPIITSGDIPNQESWSSLTSARFSWDLPKDVTLVQLLLNNSPNSTPTINYTPPIKERYLENLKDGIYYLHVRFKNENGWGKIAHRKIKIDTTGPKDIQVKYEILPNDLISLSISSKDVGSGINKYRILINGLVVKEHLTNDDKTDIILPPHQSGKYDVEIIAYDKVGNLSEKIVNIDFPITKIPQVEKYTEMIVKREKIEIIGTSYPEEDVRISLKIEGQDKEEYIVRTDSDGKFTFTSDIIEKTGLTSFYLEAIRSDGVISEQSNKYFVTVEKTDFVKTGLITIEVLLILIPILILLVILIYIALHLFYRIKKTKRRLMTDLKATETDIHKIFRLLKEDAKKVLDIFENTNIKRNIDEDEKENIRLLSKDIKEAEDYFAKRIKTIEEKDLEE
jgi:hypothetical protein